ncbi:hypothetical protein A45J_1122 [hot springs metagenome]|uniref:Uncharacterized protein n=1 Tax=hot springs metagenome TaxID=433727 RepID=A0A5J4L0U7_9ZZZZ
MDYEFHETHKKIDIRRRINMLLQNELKDDISELKKRAASLRGYL